MIKKKLNLFIIILINKSPIPSLKHSKIKRIDSLKLKLSNNEYILSKYFFPLHKNSL